MAKFYGKIGFGMADVETAPGVWNPEPVERYYSGDVLQNFMRHEVGESVNDNITISNQISIIGDPYAYQNFHSMKYIWYMGARWKIMNVDVKHPRLILTIGGVYNE